MKTTSMLFNFLVTFEANQGVTLRRFSFSTICLFVTFINKPESNESCFVINEWEDMIIFCPNIIQFLCFQLENYEKRGIFKQSFCIKISKTENSFLPHATPAAASHNQVSYL